MEVIDFFNVKGVKGKRREFKKLPAVRLYLSHQKEFHISENEGNIKVQKSVKHFEMVMHCHNLIATETKKTNATGFKKSTMLMKAEIVSRFEETSGRITRLSTFLTQDISTEMFVSTML